MKISSINSYNYNNKTNNNSSFKANFKFTKGTVDFISKQYAKSFIEIGMPLALALPMMQSALETFFNLLTERIRPIEPLDQDIILDLSSKACEYMNSNPDETFDRNENQGVLMTRSPFGPGYICKEIKEIVPADINADDIVANAKNMLNLVKQYRRF